MDLRDMFTPGDIVDVTIQGARYVGRRDGNVALYLTQAGGEDVGHEIHLGKGWPGHTMTRVAPAQFPPQPGDLWRSWVRVPVTNGSGYTVGSQLIAQTWVARTVRNDDGVGTLLLFLTDGEANFSQEPADVATGSAKAIELIFRPDPVGEDDPETNPYEVPGDTHVELVRSLTEGTWVFVDGQTRRVRVDATVDESTHDVTLTLNNSDPQRPGAGATRTYRFDDKLLVVDGDLKVVDDSPEVF